MRILAVSTIGFLFLACVGCFLLPGWESYRGPIPKNLEECFTQLDTVIGPQARQQFIDSSESIAAKAHFGLGMWIRNNWGLWKGSSLSRYFNSLGIFHPDDMSAIILTSYWRQLHRQPIRLEEQIAFYKAYWERTRQEQKQREQASTRH